MAIKQTNKIIFLGILLFCLLTFSLPLTAVNAVECNQNEPEGTVALCDPLSNIPPQTLIGKIINAVLGVVGSIALIMFIYGGFTWMTAAGNEQSVAKGKEILIWATIGLVVIFSSYALVKFVFTGLGV